MDIDRLTDEFSSILDDFPLTMTYQQKSFTVNQADLVNDVRNKWPKRLDEYLFSLWCVKADFTTAAVSIPKAADIVAVNGESFKVLIADTTIDGKLLKLHLGKKI